ncbi:MAG TPA: hypothetical protein VH540_20650 [Ktedonobacterales bacterium]|jgi:hypothetical protein
MTTFTVILIVISSCACLINVGLGLWHRQRAWVLPVRLVAGVVSFAPLAGLVVSRAYVLHLGDKLGLNTLTNAFIAIGVFIALTLMVPSWIDHQPKKTADNEGKEQKVGHGKVRFINGSDEWVN